MKTVVEIAQAVGYPLMVFEGQPYVSPELKRLVDAAVAQEREACAQLCEDQWQTAHDIQDAIRARGQA